ncbi:MAG: GspH/FimT family pseudopilin [Gammaproteobacteria bacterium]|nr:GspH/FimT family pseudopilin [Gammaproteobacteria bacterium]MCW9031492.1 GspH/FimT family pseudopilin [Gammaproteobacteria bacterium]
MTKNNHGFTLIELIVTMAVFAILVAVAAPSFNSFVDSSRRASEVNLLSGALSYARSEAIKFDSTISICAQTDGAETCSGTNDWSNGWIVFADTDSDGVIDTGESKLRIFKPIAAGSAITETSTNAPSALTFRGSGFITVASAEFKYCGNRGVTDARAIIISKTGRARLSIDSNDAGTIHENGSGTDLTCP